MKTFFGRNEQTMTVAHDLLFMVAVSIVAVACLTIFTTVEVIAAGALVVITHVLWVISYCKKKNNDKKTR